MTDDNLDEKKAAFAALLLRNPLDPMKCALAVFPGDQQAGQALWAANSWPKDPIVVAAMQSVDLNDLLPSKTELLQKIWDKMQTRMPHEDFVKMAKLYAEVRGFIDKPGTNIAVTVEQPRVMAYRDHGSNAEWEAAAAKQQFELTNNAATKH